MIEISDRIRSHHLANERLIWTITPSRKETADSLTILLDGELYRDRVGVVSVLENLRSREAISDSWFVMVSMESVESRWKECPCYLPFAQFIADELLPWLKTKHPELSRIRNTVLVGLSYTGLAATFVAFRYPGMFQKVISQSGSFWSNDCWLVNQFNHLPEKFPTAFYLDVGVKETAENIRHKEDVLQVVSQIDAIRLFRDTLTNLGFELNYVEFDGGHEFEAWKRTLPLALTWALKHQT